MEPSYFIDLQDLKKFLSDLVICSMYCKRSVQQNFQKHDHVDFLHRTIVHFAHFEVLTKFIFLGHTIYFPAFSASEKRETASAFSYKSFSQGPGFRNAIVNDIFTNVSNGKNGSTMSLAGHKFQILKKNPQLHVCAIPCLQYQTIAM